MENCRAIPAGFESDDDDFFDQKITIVKSTKLLDGFDATLPEKIDSWLKNFEKTYNTYKRNPLTEQQLKNTLLQNENPLLLALKLFANSPGCNNLKNKNLALFVLEFACEIAIKNTHLTEICDDNTRMVAFNCVKLCGINSIYKTVIKAFEMKLIRHHLLPKLQELLEQGHYKDVAYWTIFLEMTDSFGIFDLVFPLMLQDKIFLAEEYIDIAQKLQLPMVQFLDSLLNREKTVYEHCDEILAKHNYIDIKHGILLHKPMLKLVSRLAKKYKISEKYTPNLVFSKTCNYLRYLFYKYREGGMNCEAWRELIPDVAQRKEVQVELIKVLVNHNDINEAYHWMDYFGISLKDCSEEIQSILNQSEYQTTTKADAAEKSELNASGDISESDSFADEFLKLNLNRGQIIIVDDEKSFSEMLENLRTHTLIAFDSEWKPSVSSENIVSLLQLATTDNVYLLDCLSPNLKADDWKTLGREVFNNLEVLKIGFALENDLRMLQKSLPLQMSLHGGKVCFLDLRDLWRRLKGAKIIKLPYANIEDTGESLSALTEACFGKKLDKSNQCSNWSIRPLRSDQITYAALDAFCLLQIYQLFADSLKHMGLDIDKVVEEVTTGKTGYLFQMKSSVIYNSVGPSSSNSNKQNFLENNQATLSASDVSFICDQELNGLSKELRKLGIDCQTISNMDLEFHLVELKRDQCFLLTKHPQRYYNHLRECGREKCVKIHSNSAGDQAAFVLNHFKIKVHERFLFTRCLECNCNEFILALKEEIVKMRIGKTHGTHNCKDLETANVIKQDGHFMLRQINEHILSTKLTYRGQPIRLQRIKEHHLKNVKQFLICDSCGYVIWNGAHPMHGNVLKIVGCEAQRFPCV